MPTVTNKCHRHRLHHGVSGEMRKKCDSHERQLLHHGFLGSPAGVSEDSGPWVCLADIGFTCHTP